MIKIANSLGELISGKYVIVKNEGLKQSGFPINLDDPICRVFLCDGGYGCYPFTYGSCIVGDWIVDGERDRIEGNMVKRFATNEEVEKAKKFYEDNVKS